jgi:hypothetical protein
MGIFVIEVHDSHSFNENVSLWTLFCIVLRGHKVLWDISASNYAAVHPRICYHFSCHYDVGSGHSALPAGLATRRFCNLLNNKGGLQTTDEISH